MSLTISQSLTAVGPNITSSFLADGGTGPYVYSVLMGGAGGTIDVMTGVYTAPPSVPSNPSLQFDTIQVMDSAANMATAQILVGNSFTLLLDVIQTYMGLPNDHCYMWDQKIFQPTDSNPYVVLSIMSCKPFGNTNYSDTSGSGLISQQSINMSANVSIDILSRGPAARDRKEEILLALNSNYALSQQYANSFYIAKLSSQFTNLSNIDGAAIPYRYSISVAIQYFFIKTNAVPYYDTFSAVTVTTEP